MTSPNDENHSSPWGRSGTQASRDWAQHGHRDVVTQLVNVYGARSEHTSTTPADEPIRSQRSRRTARSLAVLVAVIASAGSAHALGGAVFAGSGDETTRSVWQNPGRNAADDPVQPATTPDSGAVLTLASVPPSTTSLPAAEPDDTTAIALPNVTHADHESTDRPSTSVAGDIDDRDETMTGVQAQRGRHDTSSPPNDDDDDDQRSDDSDHPMSDHDDQRSDDNDHRGSKSDHDDQRSDDNDHRGSKSDHDDQRSDDSGHRGSMSESDSGSHSGRGGSKRPGD